MEKNNILDYIGNTPLLNMEGTYGKCEFFNPSGSVKDRIAKYFVEKAEKVGLLKDGYTIVEASTGNTGIALSMVGTIKGYKVIIYIPHGLTKERYQIIRLFGAELRLVDKDRTDIAVKKAIEMGKKHGYFHINQFKTEWNVEEHQNFMGQEIIKQLNGKKIDAIVAGIGTGGTLIGLAKAFKKNNPELKVYGMEPEECALTYSLIHNLPQICKPHKIEGIGDGFVPDIIKRDIKIIDDVIKIKSSDAIEEAKRIVKQYGCFVGICSGANLLAAKQVKKENPDLKTIVTILTDRSGRYLSENLFSP